MFQSTGCMKGCSPFLGGTVLKILQLPTAPFLTFGLFGQSKLSLQKHAPSEIVAFLSVSKVNVTNLIAEHYNLDRKKCCLSPPHIRVPASTFTLTINTKYLQNFVPIRANMRRKLNKTTGHHLKTYSLWHLESSCIQFYLYQNILSASPKFVTKINLWPVDL